MKKRSSGELFSWLDQEYAWRLKEIADLKDTIEGSEEGGKKALLRAFVPILYAHWEGFIKVTSEALLDYVSQCNLPYNALTPNYVVYGIQAKFNDYKYSGNFKKSVELVEFFTNSFSDPCTIAPQLVKTNSNLNSEVFEQIALSLGIDPDPYKTRYVFLDVSLLKKRNKIAHGHRIDADEREVTELTKGVLDLMLRYKSDIQQIVTDKAFHLAPPSPPLTAVAAASAL